MSHGGGRRTARRSVVASGMAGVWSIDSGHRHIKYAPPAGLVSERSGAQVRERSERTQARERARASQGGGAGERSETGRGGGIQGN